MKSKVVAILETRTGAHLAELIARRGAIPLSAPALEEVPDVAPDALPKLLSAWRERPFALAIFQTGVGTKALFAAAQASGDLAELLALLEMTTVAVRGPKPVGELNARQVRIDVRAPTPFTTQELVTALADLPLMNASVMVQRYGAANPALRAALSARGATIHEIATYRWSVPTDTGPLKALMLALREQRVDAAVFTSAVQVDNLMTVAQLEGCAGELPAWLNRVTVGSIGPVCSRALQAHGVMVSFEASPPKLGPMLTALEAALSDAAP